MDFQKITQDAFIDELKKLASIGSIAKMTMMEMKGALPKGTAVAETQRAINIGKTGQGSLFSSARPSRIAQSLSSPIVPQAKFNT
jgi:hypothetical protein